MGRRELRATPTPVPAERLGLGAGQGGDTAHGEAGAGGELEC